MYIENENDKYLSNCYFAAIVLKYWNKIYNLYANTYLTATMDDAYNWVIEGIMYALKHRKWKDKTNKLYFDENAPDKVINRKIKCLRLNHLISQNRNKRKVQINLLSLDSFDDSDNLIETDDVYDATKELVQTIYKNNAFDSVVIDLILHDDCFEKNESTGTFEFKIEKLVDLIEQLDDDYYNYFSKYYNLTFDDVRDNITNAISKYDFSDLWGYGKTFVKKSKTELNDLTMKSLENLKNNEGVIDFLC